MTPRAKDIRDLSLLSVATAVGGALAPSFAFVGVPLVGAGAAGLAYRGRGVLAMVAGALGVVLAAALQPVWLAFALPALVAMLVAVALLPSRSYQLITAGLVVVFGVAAYVMDSLVTASQGTTVPALFTRESATAVEEFTKAVQASGSAAPEGVAEFAKTFASLWPSIYFQAALITAVLGVVAIAWAARRLGRVLPVPPLSKVDLTINVVWLPVVALFALSLSRISGMPAWVAQLGLNLAIVAATLLFVQGIAVTTWFLERVGVPVAARVFVYVGIVLFSPLLIAVVVLGLADFWLDFRKLRHDSRVPEAQG